MRVVITGAAGRLGTILSDGLRRPHRELVLSDLTAITASDLETHRVDLTGYDEVTDLLSGADAVVHLAGIPDEAPFGELMAANMWATRNVFEAARETGVRHVVYASSAHVVGMYRPDDQLTPDTPPAPDSMYAVTKLFGENVGQLYARKHDMAVTCLRIGSFRPTPENGRQLATWLSPADAVQLFDRCLDNPPTGMRVLYGVSANARGWWVDDAAATIGYSAADDAERFASHLDRSRFEFQGGPFAEPNYRGGAG